MEINLFMPELLERQAKRRPEPVVALGPPSSGSIDGRAADSHLSLRGVEGFPVVAQLQEGRGRGGLDLRVFL